MQTENEYKISYTKLKCWKQADFLEEYRWRGIKYFFVYMKLFSLLSWNVCVSDNHVYLIHCFRRRAQKSFYVFRSLKAKEKASLVLTFQH